MHLISRDVQFVLTIFSAWFTLSFASFELKIKPHGEKFIKPWGTSIVFTCEVCEVGNDQAMDNNFKIQWFDEKNKEIVDNSGQRVYVEKDGIKIKKLYITAIDKDDAGRYSCSVTVGGVKEEKSVILALFKDITFDHAPNPQHPAIYTPDALIECQVSGQPEPEVSWRYNGQLVVFGSRYVKDRAKGLRIKNITKADNGNYTCRAEVDADGRYDERRITVVVHVPPKVTEGPGNVQGIAGQDLMITCRADGDPSPSFEFIKDNKIKLLSNSASDRIQVDGHIGKVSFKPLKKEDEGHYTCKALNDVGDDQKQGKLTVLVPPQIHELKNITTNDAVLAKITCKSHGSPAPNMTFNKIDQPAFKTGSNENGRIMVTLKSHGNLELSFKNTIPSDTAAYVCKSHNTAGNVSAVGYVTVLYKPKFSSDHKKSDYSWAGRVHNISCTAEAQPAPAFRWYRGGHALTNNETYTVYNLGKSSNLQVKVKEADQSWIYSDYVCQAYNGRGITNHTIKLLRASVPNPPFNVTSKEISPNMLILIVEPPVETGGVKLVGYRVEYENKVQDFSIAVDPKSKGKSNIIHHGEEIKIENLRPGTQYVIRVRAKNEVGVGNYINHSVTTANMRKPYPIKLTSPKRSPDSNQYRITWEKPRTGGRPITKYLIQYRRVKDGKVLEDWIPKTKYESPGSPPAVQFVLTDLMPHTEYQLQITATSEIGNSDKHDAFSFRTADFPRPGSSSGCSSVVYQLLAKWETCLLLSTMVHLFISTSKWTTIFA